MNNQLVQALGVGLFFYIIFKLLGVGLYSLSRILSTFATWYKHSAIPYAEEAAIALGIIFLLVSVGISTNNQRR